MRKELLVGLFSLAGLGALTASIFMIKDIRFEPGYRLYAEFNDVSNLMEKAWVRMRGVRVGTVQKVELEGEIARITVWIRSGVRIHRGAQARITSTGVLGVKFLELTLGDPAAPLLRDGDTIENTQAAVSIDDVIAEAMVGMRGASRMLNELASDRETAARIKTILANLEQATGRLNAALADGRLVRAIDSIGTAGDSVGDLARDARSGIADALETLQETSARINDFVERFASTGTVAGQLLNDPETGRKFSTTLNSLQDTASQASRTLGRINLFTTSWDFGSRYDLSSSDLRGDVLLRVVPRARKHYFLGVSNVASAAAPQSGPRPHNTFNVGIGGTLGDLFTVYGGMLRSSAGLGVSVSPLAGGTGPLELGAEVCNLSASGADVDVLLRLRVVRWLLLGTRYEYTAGTGAFNATLNVTFVDEDIAYLLGLLSLAN